VWRTRAARTPARVKDRREQRVTMATDRMHIGQTWQGRWPMGKAKFRVCARLGLTSTNCLVMRVAHPCGTDAGEGEGQEGAERDDGGTQAQKRVDLQPVTARQVPANENSSWG
jgi:hypothetical protein